MYTLISATPSPYARKVRIALAEKGIRLTPDVLVSGSGAGAASASEGLVALLTSQLARKN